MASDDDETQGLAGMRGLTILGTDTDVGKSYVACHIIREMSCGGKRVAAYKPVASGSVNQSTGDAFELWNASGHLGSLEEVNPQHFCAPVAPPIAAQLESREVNESLLLSGAAVWRNRCEALVIEGAGGIMSPLSFQSTNAELACSLGFPVILVAINKLGVVNQVLSAMTTAKRFSLDVQWVVLNDGLQDLPDPSKESNLQLLMRFFSKYQMSPGISCMRKAANKFEPRVDWWEVVERTRHGNDYDDLTL